MTTEILRLGLWSGLALASFYVVYALIAEHMPFMP